MTEEKSVLGLATIRKNRGISLEQIAASTKIGVRSLEAIERGDFQKLPGGIYSTSYIRQYARAIDYDESALLEFYHRETGAGTFIAGTATTIGARSADSVPRRPSRNHNGYFQPSSTMRPSFSTAAEAGFTEMDPITITLMKS